MFENEFTMYLLNNDWEQINPMSFSKDFEDIVIHFDTSNQIEVYKGNVRIGSYYIQEVEDLKQVLDKLK